MDTAPGGKLSGTPVEANAESLGKLFKMRFVACTGATEASAPNVATYSAGRGPRLRVWGPRATLFFPDAPSSRTAPAWLQYEMFQDRLVARRLAAQAYRIFGWRRDAPDLRGGL